MEIPSTPTVLDKNRESKRLSEEIATLKSLHESVSRETKETVRGADAALERAKAIRGEIEGLMAIRDQVARETSEFIAFCGSILREYGVKMTEMTHMASLMEKEAETASHELERAKEGAKAVHESAVVEQADIQRKKDDLDIYHERLKAYFRKHLPDQNIIL